MKSVEYCFIKERMLTKPSPGIWSNISATRTIYFSHFSKVQCNTW